MIKYVTIHKFSEPRRKNFKVIIRCLRRFELFWRKEGHKAFKMTFANLKPELLSQIEEFLLNIRRYTTSFRILPKSR